MVRLPVSGVDVQLRLPTGADDLVLLEAGPPDLEVAVELLARVAIRSDGLDVDWSTLTMTDVDVLLLHLRRRVLGDIVKAEVRCDGDGCGELVDIAFSIAAYLEHHRARRPTRAVDVGGGWFRLDGTDAEFRLPVVDDLLAASASEGEQALLIRCIRPPDAASGVRRRIESTMEAMAPSLASELRGTCPECGATVSAFFDPLQYALRELRDQASFLYEDICAIARLTHWSEADILALPAARRARYAELAHPQMVHA